MADLSGGQLQRVLLARAILARARPPAARRADAGARPAGRRRLLPEPRRRSATRLGCAILMVSHDLHVVMSASDRVVCLNGHVCCEGTPAVVSAAPAYRELFGTGTEGALALYQHHHDHADHAAHHHHPHREEA